MEMRGVMDDLAQLASPIMELPQIGSPQFEEPMELLGMISKMDEKELSRQVFGEKTFDFTDLRGDAPMVIDQVGSIGIPKDAKRRANFEKLMMGQDQ